MNIHASIVRSLAVVGLRVSNSSLVCRRSSRRSSAKCFFGSHGPATRPTQQIMGQGRGWGIRNGDNCEPNRVGESRRVRSLDGNAP